MRKRHLLIEIAQTVALTVVAFYLLQTFIAQPFRVEQGSMRITFEPGEYVLVDKLSSRLTGLHRGDVVIFHPPESWPSSSDNTPYIKRVVGLPGELVTIGADGVRINDALLTEDYVYLDGGGNVEEPQSWRLAADELLVFGDHRSNSSDSRAYGPIPVSAVVGRAVIRYYPIDRMSLITPPPYSIAVP
jgi:signal peptidase I